MFDQLTDRDLAELARLERAEEELIAVLMAEPQADPEPPMLPPDLDRWPVGLPLAMLLAEVDPDELSPADRVAYLKAANRLTAHHQAGMYRAMNAISDAYAALDPNEIPDAAADTAFEIRAALRWTRRAADSELGFAHDLRRRLPGLLAAFSAGTIDRRRAAVILRHTDHLSIGAARTVCERVIEDAPRLTTGQLVERVRRAVLDHDPDAVRTQHEAAVADRRVVSYPDPEGTVSLAANGLDPVRAQQALSRINRIARDLRVSGEARSMDQLRADVFMDLLCGDTNPTTSGSVHITTDLATLARLAEHPGDLAGYGPVIADIARQTTRQLGTSPWEWTVTHPDTGMPISDGTTRRRPTSSQTRTVRTRTRTCIAPGCRMPTVNCDLDHTQPWAEHGVTDSEGLEPLCRHDHCIRHQTGWTYAAIDDGDYLWTSPLGTAYTTSGRDP